MPPQWFLLRVRVILFLLLNKQKIITYNTVESPSAVISMMSWVTEYLSMKKYHEGSPTLTVHSCFLTIRLLPCHLLVSIFIFHLLCTFTSAHTSLPTTYVLLTCTWMSMWGVTELKEDALANPLLAYASTALKAEIMKKCTSTWTTLSL